MSEPELRHAARILLIDAQDRLLLFRAIPQAFDGDAFWFTPGGGLSPGETHQQAVARELREETGLSAPVGPCVWTRRHIFRFKGAWYDQRERFYVVRVPVSRISTDGWEDVEREMMDRGHWWTHAEIAASAERFAPRRLAALLPPILAGEYPTEPLDAGV